MDNSLYPSLKEYAKKDMSSFHTPGHKGVGSLDLAYDITEIDGFESLYSGEGAISKTEEKLSAFLGATSVISVGGSTLCVETMISLCANIGDTVITMRGVHQSVIHSFALLGITPFWIFPKVDPTTGLALMPTKAEVEKAITACPQGKSLLITSPDYYGQTADIAGISEACKSHGVTLMVDSAHGAHYSLLEPNIFPINLGADICSSSLHKTLPVMTGGAALSFNENFTASEAKTAMNIFASTSPSYAIMYSIDKMLTEGKSELSSQYRELAVRVDKLRGLAVTNGFTIPFINCDPIRLTLGFAALGYTKTKIQNLLHSYKIEAEYIDTDYLVLILTSNNSGKDLGRLDRFIREIKPLASRSIITQAFHVPQAKLSIREAVFKKGVSIEVARAVGKVAGTTIAPCPPGIPLIIPGEVVDESLVAALKKVGIMQVNVV